MEHSATNKGLCGDFCMQVQYQQNPESCVLLVAKTTIYFPSQYKIFFWISHLQISVMLCGVSLSILMNYKMLHFPCAITLPSSTEPNFQKYLTARIQKLKEDFLNCFIVIPYLPILSFAFVLTFT